MVRLSCVVASTTMLVWDRRPAASKPVVNRRPRPAATADGDAVRLPELRSLTMTTCPGSPPRPRPRLEALARGTSPARPDHRRRSRRGQCPSIYELSSADGEQQEGAGTHGRAAAWGRSLEKSAPGAEPRCDRHDVALAEVVDRRVRDLGEALLQEGKTAAAISARGGWAVSSPIDEVGSCPSVAIGRMTTVNSSFVIAGSDLTGGRGPPGTRPVGGAGVRVLQRWVVERANAVRGDELVRGP